MKKYLILTIFLLLFFSQNKTTNAVDQFGCKWFGTECHIGTDQCGAGWHSDDSVCTANKEADSCNRTVASCIQNSDVKKWKCGSGSDLGKCIPADPTDPLAVFPDSTCGNTCQKPITTPGYRCNTTSHTCESDPNSSTTLLDCTNSCNVNSNIPDFSLGNANFGCDTGKGTGTGVDTAIGCIPVNNLTNFLSFLLRWILGISGGIILLMSIATGYALMTSSGDPQKLQGAKENLVAIFSGLILIGFSLVLLQVIGADILKLPTF